MAAATGAVLVVAATPDRAPEQDAKGSAGGGPHASVTLLVGRALDEGDGGIAARCAVEGFRDGLCTGWRQQRVRATARGAGSVLRGPASREADGPARTVVLPTNAGGPLEIALAQAGALTDVTVRDGHGRYVGGTLAPKSRRWTNTEPLRAGELYTVRVGAQDAAGTPVGVTMAFRTTPPPDEGRLTVEFGPRPGTYGAGRIVTAALSRPVPATDRTARARVERALQVTSEPAVEGGWHWVDDSTLHYRPRTYWPAHAEVHVTSGLDGVEVGDHGYGGPSDSTEFTIGDRIEAVTDSAAHEMTVRRNGRVIRTIPVTTGKAGFRTRSGVKVVLGKEYQVRMRGDTVGIKRGTSEFYDLPVFYATRVTWSGEYVHAAPWSVASQGEENVSHGCTGMSTTDAAWFFQTVREGDIVQVVNSGGKPMAPFDNGFGDWNLDWRAWQAGSALTSAPVPAAAHPAVSRHAPSRLRPLT
ncbi:Ig-like domain-containing protein [Streptomyces sp. NBC_01443]|uniref:L,D-transpeptidase n=1 Tax=Streptomyces sp. NBC_01443 TaxID=2903868 RepID=UPI002257C1D3|nr:Ig-like domain-containing protein [Streptomyces sp. NBC_01443]MCX4625746.1 Ig-like domain-containing protein [Streptomyces sp. NBC_01443]